MPLAPTLLVDGLVVFVLVVVLELVAVPPLPALLVVPLVLVGVVGLKAWPAAAKYTDMFPGRSVSADCMLEYEIHPGSTMMAAMSAITRRNDTEHPWLMRDFLQLRFEKL